MLCRQVLLAEPESLDALMLLATLCQVQGPTLRFAHSRVYLQEMAAQAGMREIAMNEAVLRRERGKDVAALVVVLATAQ